MAARRSIRGHTCAAAVGAIQAVWGTVRHNGLPVQILPHVDARTGDSRRGSEPVLAMRDLA